jgi:Ca2+-binding RTX toxin-like protein
LGGPGRDNLSGRNGWDLLRGGPGNDFLRGNIGSDRLRGQAGDDFLTGTGDSDVAHGGTGDDFIKDRGKGREVSTAVLGATRSWLIPETMLCLVMVEMIP